MLRKSKIKVWNNIKKYIESNSDITNNEIYEKENSIDYDSNNNEKESINNENSKYNDIEEDFSIKNDLIK